MSLPLLRVDTRGHKAFINRVPMAKDTKTALDAIEKTWRAKHKGLRGLVGKDGKGIVPESSWYRWKTGESEPPYSELLRIARAVGCDLRPSGNGVIDGTAGVRVITLPGGVPLSPETMAVVEWMEGEGATDELRGVIRSLVQAEILKRAANPRTADADIAGPAPRSK